MALDILHLDLKTTDRAHEASLRWFFSRSGRAGDIIASICVDIGCNASRLGEK